MTRRLLVAVALVAAAAMAVMGLPAVAPAAAAVDDCTIWWDGGGDALSWHDAANWDMSAVPVTGDVVCIPSGAGVAYSGGSLSIGGAEVDGKLFVSGGSLAVDGEAVFKTLTVEGGTLTGTGLQNAIDPADGKIVKDNLVNYITVGGDVLVSSVRVLSSSEHTLQFKVFFSGFVQDVTVDLSFRTAGNVNVPLLNGLKRRIRMKSANVRNYVRSITFPNGSTFDKNSIATVRLNLLFPAPSDGVGTVTIGGRSITTGLSVGNTNRKVYLKLVPGNAFVAVQNGTPINANGITTVLANPGDDVITLTFKVADCLGGMPGTVNTVKLQTWMHTTNTNLPPNFIEQSFGVRCTQ